MKALLRRLAAEWEKTLFWVTVALLVVFIGIQLVGLLHEGEGDTTASSGGVKRPSLLNEETAFAFLQPLPAPGDEVRNPFAFTCKIPPQAQAAVQPAERRAWRRDKTPTPPPPAPAEQKPAPQPQVAEQKPPPPKAAAPAPPKRSVSIAYRGVYKGGDDPGRQLAFLTARPGDSGTTALAVAAVGEAVGGVTVKSFSPEVLVVTAPTGEEVTITLGEQKKIQLE